MSGFYYVKVPNEPVFECRARGKFKKENIKPVVGDLVEIQAIGNGQGVIEIILPRKNCLVRPSVANIDQLMVVFAATSPEPDFLLMDRLTVLAEKNKLFVTICITKTDLDDKNNFNKVVGRYSNTDYKIIGLSNKLNRGIEDIKDVLAGKLSTLSGPSGVGKSTLINTINPNFKLNVGDVSIKTKRGKHTTTHCELLEVIEDGFVVDTPGFTSLELEGISEYELAKFFPDFNKFNNCQFVSCAHENEELCGVKDAVKSGELSKERYKNYLLLLQEVRENGGKYR